MIGERIGELIAAEREDGVFDGGDSLGAESKRCEVDDEVAFGDAHGRERFEIGVEVGVVRLPTLRGWRCEHAQLWSHAGHSGCCELCPRGCVVRRFFIAKLISGCSTSLELLAKVIRRQPHQILRSGRADLLVRVRRDDTPRIHSRDDVECRRWLGAWRSAAGRSLLGVEKLMAADERRWTRMKKR